MGVLLHTAAILAATNCGRKKTEKEQGKTVGGGLNRNFFIFQLSL